MSKKPLEEEIEPIYLEEEVENFDRLYKILGGERAFVASQAVEIMKKFLKQKTIFEKMIGNALIMAGEHSKLQEKLEIATKTLKEIIILDEGPTLVVQDLCEEALKQIEI